MNKIFLSKANLIATGVISWIKKNYKILDNIIKKLTESNIGEFLAIFLAGVCYGHIEITYTSDQAIRVIEVALAVVAGTVILGRSFRNVDSNKGIIANLLESHKSAWPIAIFLSGFILNVRVVSFIKWLFDFI